MSFVTNPYRFGAAYDAAAAALFARMSSQPDSTRKGLINTLIVALKAASIWTKIEGLWVLAAHDSQAAGLNWISTSFDLTAVNAPTFTTDRGYAGDGSTSYLDTGWTPSASSIFLQDSGAVGCWANTNPTGNNLFREMGGETGTNRISLVAHSSTNGTSRGRLNQNADALYAGGPATRVGMSILSRTGSTTVKMYRQGSLVATDATASTGRPAHPLFLCGGNDDGVFTNGVTTRLALAFVSSGLDDTEAAAFEAAAETFLTAIGAN